VRYEAVPRSAMSASIKANQCDNRAVLKKYLDLLKKYVEKNQPKEVRGKQYKKIRLALIRALADCLQIKLN
jgi:oligoribonuclease (3'-5' exoribonuclease)